MQRARGEEFWSKRLADSRTQGRKELGGCEAPKKQMWVEKVRKGEMAEDGVEELVKIS